MRRIIAILFLALILGGCSHEPSAFEPHVIKWAHGPLMGEQYIIVNQGDRIREFRNCNERIAE